MRSQVISVPPDCFPFALLIMTVITDLGSNLQIRIGQRGSLGGKIRNNQVWLELNSKKCREGGQGNVRKFVREECIPGEKS